MVILSPRNRRAAASFMAASPMALAATTAGIASTTRTMRNIQTRESATVPPFLVRIPIHRTNAKAPAANTKTVPAGMVPMPRKTRNRERYICAVRSRISDRVSGWSGSFMPAPLVDGSCVFKCKIGFNGRQGGRHACVMHHAFNVVALVAHALVIVEEGESSCVDGCDKRVGEECEELLHYAHPHGQHAVVFDACKDEESLGDAGEAQLDDEGKERQHEDAPARALAELNAAANRGASTEVLNRAGGNGEGIAQAHDDAVHQCRAEQE